VKTIIVLGSGCARCRATLKLIEDAALAMGVPVRLDKVEDLPSIMGYGVMSTPGVVIDGMVVHRGGIPTRDQIDAWLRAPAARDGEDVARSATPA
jgi:small redox-active disulfide protein 2